MSRTEKCHQWQSIIDRQANSGLSKAAFCRQEVISLATFYYWSKQLREQSDVPMQTVIPLRLDSSPAAALRSESEQLVLTLPNGNQLAFPATLAPARLQQFVMALSV